jgi:hypothetical protein
VTPELRRIALDMFNIATANYLVTAGWTPSATKKDPRYPCWWRKPAVNGKQARMEYRGVDAIAIQISKDVVAIYGDEK